MGVCPGLHEARGTNWPHTSVVPSPPWGTGLHVGAPRSVRLRALNDITWLCVRVTLWVCLGMLCDCVGSRVPAPSGLCLSIPDPMDQGNKEASLPLQTSHCISAERLQIPPHPACHPPPSRFPGFSLNLSPSLILLLPQSPLYHLPLKVFQGLSFFTL